MNGIVISRIPVSRETTPTLCAHQTYVPCETPTILKHNKTTHPTTKATWSQPTKPQQPPQTNHHVSRETSLNTQRSLFSRWKNPFMPTNDKLERIRHLSYFSLLLKSSHACQCLETLNRISQQLNKIQNQCFTWNTTSSTTTRERVLKNHHQQLNHPTLRFTWNTLTSLGRRKAKTTFHVKQMGCCKNVVFHVKHREAFKHQKTQPSPPHNKTKKTQN